MARERMFEYTPTDIEKHLEDLNTKALSYLRQLPTFLCSEIDRSGHRPSMLVRYGRLSQIEADRREVPFNFETILDFGDVLFDNIDAARNALVADEY